MRVSTRAILRPSFDDSVKPACKLQVKEENHHHAGAIGSGITPPVPAGRIMSLGLRTQFGVTQPVEGAGVTWIVRLTASWFLYFAKTHD